MRSGLVPSVLLDLPAMPEKDSDDGQFGSWPPMLDRATQPASAEVRTDELGAMLTAHFDRLAKEPLPQNLLDLLGRLEAINPPRDSD